MGCFPILLCFWEDCPSLGQGQRRKPELYANRGCTAKQTPPLLGAAVPRVTVGTQEIGIMGKGRPSVLPPVEGPLRSSCLEG